MKTEKQEKTTQKKSLVKKLLIITAVIVAALILLVAVAIPAYISSEGGRKTILAKINGSVDGKADFATLSMGWFKGVKLTDLSFNDSAGTTSVTVKEVSVKPQYASILTGTLALGKTVIDRPNIEITLPRPAIEPETPPAAPKESGKPQAVMLPVQQINLVVNDGRVKVTDPQAGTAELTAINSEINLNPPGQKSDFAVAATLVAEGAESNIQASGTVTPDKKTGWLLEGTSGELTIEINDLSLESLAPVFAAAGADIEAKGRLSANLTGRLEKGKLRELNGTANGSDIDVTMPALKGDRIKTKVLAFDTKIKADENLINIDTLNLKTDWADIDANGTAPADFKAFDQMFQPGSTYDLKADFNVNIAALAAQMPKTLGIKEDMKLTSGKLSGDIRTVTETGRKKIAARADVENLAGTVGGKTASLSQPIKAVAEIVSEKDAIRFDKVGLTASFADITCSGTTESLDYNANVDLAKLQADLGQFLDFGKYQMAGTVTKKGSVTSKEDVITVTGTAACKDIRLTSPEGVTAAEPAAEINYAMVAEPKKNFMSIGSLAANAGFGQVSIKDAVLPLNEKSEKPLKLDVSANLDLAKLQGFAILFGALPKDMQLSGTAVSNISVTSEKDLYNVYTDSTRIRNLRLVYPQKQPFVQDEVTLMLDAAYNTTDKTLNLKKLELLSPQIKIKKAQFSQSTKNGVTSLNGSADLEYDWAAISTVAAGYLPQGLMIYGKRADSISFSSHYPADKPDQLLSNLDSAAAVGFEKAEYMGMDFGQTQVNLKVAKGILNIAPFTTTVNNGKFNFAAFADFTKKPSFITMPPLPQKKPIIENININERTTNQLLKYVNPIFANSVNVTGIANFECESLKIPISAENKKDLEVIGTVSLTDVRMQSGDLLGKLLSAIGSPSGEIIKIHPTRFVLQNGFLSYENMQMDIGNNPINFKGVIGLDKSLNMTVTLPYTLQGRTARTGSETTSQRISVPLKGTLDKPEIDLAGAAESLIKQQVEQQIRRGLEGLLK